MILGRNDFELFLNAVRIRKKWKKEKVDHQKDTTLKCTLCFNFVGVSYCAAINIL